MTTDDLVAALHRLERISWATWNAAALSRQMSGVCATHGPGKVIGTDGKPRGPRPTEEVEAEARALDLAIGVLREMVNRGTP